MQDVEDQPWFHGRISREEAEALLENYRTLNGTWLIRDSTSKTGDYALSLCFHSNFYHYQLTHQGNGLLSIEDGQRFESPVDFVNHHRRVEDGLLCRLSTPCNRLPGVPVRVYRGVDFEEMRKAKRDTVASLGYAPQALIKLRSKLEELASEMLHTKQPWFHGEVSRDEAESRLRAAGFRNGLFLARERDSKGSFALGLVFKGQVYHYLLDRDRYGQLSITDGRKFDNLMQAVDHYSRKADGLLCPLGDGCTSPSFVHSAPRDRRRPPPLPDGDTKPAVAPRRFPPVPSARGGGGGDGNVPLSQEILHQAKKTEGYHSIYDTFNLSRTTTRLRKESLTLKTELGAGQFGSVMKGIYNMQGKTVQVAVKTLKSDDVPNARAEILKEADAMAKLDHPHIVRLIGVCHDSPIMLVLELCQHGPLNKYLKQNSGRVPILRVVNLMTQVSDGMVYLERSRFVHRDLAARNVLVVSDNLVKISDFGMSRALGLGSDYYKADTTGKWPLKWYAPECIYYFRFDSKSDVWSFGVTLWEAVSYGGRPYKGMKGADILKMLENGERMGPPEGCPRCVYQAMKKCWEFDKKNRPGFNEVKAMMEDCIREVESGDYSTGSGESPYYIGRR